ncbi:Permeases of the major facilitator superfamily protein [Streptomyces mobaraensis NBRC 13819 = DSM 40847]|uniref:Permeases of the major facilitator superfamily protein n=1 Tax=Streptomyces mobaraensis (strain ATCC 29032 / DSM 40847 / JCM 4168 / NBRC 13819 / NCIMB 11159 / IPCR 16-22) TaxID=1223523 RepID=M3A1G6_STRM1|nr:Permeases of the major facilitator superfamily protein [Streptomyces mobaraensis NBRC 13819 = DSM 40847]
MHRDGSPTGSAGPTGPAGPTGLPAMLRLATASLVGTAIEFYDFFAYGTAAALVLGPLFFPTASPLMGTLAAFGTFGVGFIARPLGSVLFGHVGDRYGRRPVLVVSLLLTGVATVAVGLVPPYAAIGAAAPLLLLVLRFLQGLGLGGEWGGAVLLTTEHAPAHRRALWSCFPQLGPPLGFLLANGITLGLSVGLTDAQFRSWGWRVPFWVAGVLAVGGMLLRNRISESPEFHALAPGQRAPLPIAEVARDHWRLVLLSAGGLAMGYAVYYTVTTWALAYGTEQLGVDRTVMLVCVMVAVVASGVVTPPLALLGDRVGRRPLCLAGCVAVVLWMFPMVALLHTGNPVLMTVGFVVAMLAFMIAFAVVGAYLLELYAPRVRCTGATVGYNLAGILGGAVTPLVATAVTRGDRPPWGVAVYLVAVALLSLVCFALLPETRPASTEETRPAAPEVPDAPPGVTPSAAPEATPVTAPRIGLPGPRNGASTWERVGSDVRVDVSALPAPLGAGPLGLGRGTQAGDRGDGEHRADDAQRDRNADLRHRHPTLVEGVQHQLDADEAEDHRQPVREVDQLPQQAAYQEVQLAQTHEGEGVGREDDVRVLGEAEDRRD